MAYPQKPWLETATGMAGFHHWPSLLDSATQLELVQQIRQRVATAPLYRCLTPGGRPLSVQMTNFGDLGWVSDNAGYRYQPTHPVTGQSWPDIPPLLLQLWRDLAPWPELPDACLVNFYQDDARMGLHQDRDEAQLGAPVLSISLGDSAVFRIGPEAGGPTKRIKLSSGDVCMIAGPARMARHGVDKILAGSSQLLPKGGRLNLTLRKAGKPLF